MLFYLNFCYTNLYTSLLTSATFTRSLTSDIEVSELKTHSESVNACTVVMIFIELFKTSNNNICAGA